eukprot:g9527.t1
MAGSQEVELLYAMELLERNGSSSETGSSAVFHRPVRGNLCESALYSGQSSSGPAKSSENSSTMGHFNTMAALLDSRTNSGEGSVPSGGLSASGRGSAARGTGGGGTSSGTSGAGPTGTTTSQRQSRTSTEEQRSASTSHEKADRRENDPRGQGAGLQSRNRVVQLAQGTSIVDADLLPVSRSGTEPPLTIAADPIALVVEQDLPDL